MPPRCLSISSQATVVVVGLIVLASFFVGDVDAALPSSALNSAFGRGLDNMRVNLPFGIVLGNRLG